MKRRFEKYFLIIMVGLMVVGCEVSPPSPDLADDEASVMVNSSVDIDVSINDRKLAPLVISSHPVHGTAYEMGNGIIRYTPEFNYVGQDYFYYDDIDLNGPAAKVTITVLPLEEPDPQPPVDIPHD